MPSLPFTLRQLEVFASLAATGSFRRSAEKMGISQASVSNQIKTLEEQLGVALFDRKPGRRPVLRPEGLAFRDDLREFERAAAVLAAHRRKAGEESEHPRKFRLLVGQGMFDGYIRRKLDAFYDRHPHIDLEFETRWPFGELIHQVESGQFDFALINQRADRPVYPGCHQLTMVRGGIYGHRKYAEGHELPLTAAQINRLPFILPKSTSKQEREALQSYEAHGIHPRHVIGHTQYYDVMAAMLDRGLGVASFSAAILPAAMRDDVILLYPLDDWRLLYARKDGLAGSAADQVERFLIESVVFDPDYPAMGIDPAAMPAGLTLPA
ncbi:MAG: LysR family transcriptional regulator [Pseudomonadota bacterium]